MTMKESEVRSEFKALFPLIISVLLVLFLLSIYLPLTSITIQDSDGGEYATAAFFKALVHPPGYPLYMLVAETLVSIFPENPYETLALFSAAIQAFSALFLFWICYLLSKNIFLSLSTVVAWGLCDPTIRAATDVEVFALHNLFSVIIVLLSIHLLNFKLFSKTKLLILGIFCGLAGTHHQTIVLWAPLVAAAVIVNGYRTQSIAKLFLAGIIFLIGINIGTIPFALLLSPKSELVYANLGSLGELVEYILRYEYGTFSVHGSSIGEQKSYFSNFFLVTFDSFPLLALGFIAVVLFAFKRRTALQIGLFLSALFHLWFLSKLVFHSDESIYGEYVMRFYGPIILSGALCLVAAFSEFKLSKLAQSAICILLIAPALIYLPRNLEAYDYYSDKTIDYELEAVLAEVPKNGVFVATLDRIAMGLHYKQFVEKKRPDIKIIIPVFTASTSYRKVLQKRYDFLSELNFSKPLKLSDIVNVAFKKGLTVTAYRETIPPKGYSMWPLGVTWQWIPDGTVASQQDIAERLFAFCSRWPTDLSKISPLRSKSHLIIENIFLGAIEDFITGENSEHPVKVVLRKVLKSAKKGDIYDAKLFCEAGLKSLTGRTDSQTKAYSPSPKN